MAITGPTVISLATDHRTSGFRDDWVFLMGNPGKYSQCMIRYFVSLNLICIFRQNFQKIPNTFWSLSGVPDYFGRNKISSGGDLSHYSSASLY